MTRLCNTLSPLCSPLARNSKRSSSLASVLNLAALDDQLSAHATVRASLVKPAERRPPRSCHAFRRGPRSRFAREKNVLVHPGHFTIFLRMVSLVFELITSGKISLKVRAAYFLSFQLGKQELRVDSACCISGVPAFAARNNRSHNHV